MEYIDKFVDEPVANWMFKKPSETIILRQIPIASAQAFSSVYPLHEALLLKMTNNTYPGEYILDYFYHMFHKISYSVTHSSRLVFVICNLFIFFESADIIVQSPMSNGLKYPQKIH